MYSPCLYGPAGGNYGLGRVATGFAGGLAARFGDGLGLCSYYSSAESELLLARDLPGLSKFCIEPQASAVEKKLMAWVDPTDPRGNLKKDLPSKIRRKIWSQGFNDRRWKRSPEVRRIYQEARLVHSELEIPLHLRSPRAKRIFTVHDLIGLRDPETPAEGREHKSALLRQAYQAGSFFCCDSQFTADDLKDFLGVDSDRIQAAPLGLDPVFQPSDNPPALEAWRRKIGLEEGQKYIIANTGEIRRKNLVEVVRTVHQARANGFPELILVFAGVSKELPAQFTAALGSSVDWNRFVRFTGFVTDQDFRVLYSGAELMLFLSLAEGFGLPPLEAMGCGAAVVCSNQTSLPEVVASAGLLVDPKDPDAILAAVLSILESQELRTSLIQRGLQRASEFTWDATSFHLQRIWNLALS
jgi:glycosyltransferase involved in cell wall biosynthesis